jgi:hypothetical protein
MLGVLDPPEGAPKVDQRPGPHGAPKIDNIGEVANLCAQIADKAGIRLEDVRLLDRSGQEFSLHTLGLADMERVDQPPEGERKPYLGMVIDPARVKRFRTTVGGAGDPILFALESIMGLDLKDASGGCIIINKDEGEAWAFPFLTEDRADFWSIPEPKTESAETPDQPAEDETIPEQDVMAEAEAAHETDGADTEAPAPDEDEEEF